MSKYPYFRVSPVRRLFSEALITEHKVQEESAMNLRDTGLFIFLLLECSMLGESEDSCVLPDCYTDRFSIPGGLSRDDTPQIVTFTFSGTVTDRVRAHLKEVFPVSVTNANRCPASITIFALGKGSKYCDIHKLYVRGHEIAVQGFNSTWPGSWTTRQWRENTANFRADLSRDGYVPEEHIKGMRAPLQQPGGDNQFEMLADAGFLWDSTLLGGPTKLDGEPSEWPITLTHGIAPEHCKNSGFCPENHYPGLWEVPLLRLAHSPVPCTYLDACVSYKDNGLTSASKINKVLYNNFIRNYKGNRAPFQVNFRLESLEDQIQRDALKDFIQTLTGFEDVWIVSISEAVAWMQTPVDKVRALEFGAWLCPDRGYKIECDSDFQEDTDEEEEEGTAFGAIIAPKTLVIVEYVLLVASYIMFVVYDRYAHPKDKN